MAYCIFRLQKVKSKAILNQMYKHHYRFSEVPNADKEREALNEVWVQSKDNFVKEFNNRLRQLEYYDDHKFRKNGVMAFDILVAYSPSAAKTLDLEQWKAKNVEWLDSVFGKENVISMVYHYDEASCIEGGTIHGHAMVIPVDDKGKVSSSYYTNGRMKLVALQDSYAQAMKPLGLERGIRQSTAHHTTVQDFYSRLNNAVYGIPMPEREAGEEPEKYVERVKDAWREERAAHVKELVDMERKLEEAKSNYRDEPGKDRLIKSLNNRLLEYQESEAEIVHEFGSQEKLLNLGKTMTLLNEGIANYPDTEAATKIADGAAKLIAWAEEREKHKKKDISYSPEGDE